MIYRAIAKLTCLVGFGALCPLVGCDSPTTGTTPVSHDPDPTASHQNYPAAGPDSPLAKSARKANPPAK